MNARKIQVKLFVEWPRVLDPEPFVPAFHRWIQEGALDEMLVDVAQYAHVHQGPSVLLVGHASDYAIDFGEGRAGLLYSRKREAPEDARVAVIDALRRTLVAAKKLEEDKSLAEGFRFKTDELLFRLNDRLLAPNDSATLVTVEPVLRDVLGKVFAGATLSLERQGTPKELFTVSVKASGGKKATVSELLSRIS
jgi:hypothetical protein